MFVTETGKHPVEYYFLERRINRSLQLTKVKSQDSLLRVVQHLDIFCFPAILFIRTLKVFSINFCGYGMHA
jgi:hypothetical protein